MLAFLHVLYTNKETSVFFYRNRLACAYCANPLNIYHMEKGNNTNNSEVYLPTDKLNRDGNCLISVRDLHKYSRTACSYGKRLEILRTSPRGIEEQRNIYLKGTRDTSTLIKIDKKQ